MQKSAQTVEAQNGSAQGEALCMVKTHIAFTTHYIHLHVIASTPLRYTRAYVRRAATQPELAAAQKQSLQPCWEQKDFVWF